MRRLRAVIPLGNALGAAALVTLATARAQQFPSIVPERAIAAGNADLDGRITLDKFREQARNSPRLKNLPGQVEPLFRRFDASNNGALTLDEYSKLHTLRQAGMPKAGAAGAKRPSTTPAQVLHYVDAALTQKQLACRESKIRPGLATRCDSCHAQGAEKIRNGLFVDSKDGLLRGGDSGPAIVPGNPDQSLLIQAIRYDDESLRMLPKEKLPAAVFCNGTGSTKRGSGAGLTPGFVERGFAFLAFDHRGWGESDIRRMLVEPMPKPDEKGEVTVRARAIRWQMDAADETFDIPSAIDFLAGDPNVDPERIGIISSSYADGLVTWVVGHDPRVKCLVAQVPGMGGGRSPAALRFADGLSTKQARGQVEPVPIETGKLQGQMARHAQIRANPAKGRDYNPVADASRISAPTLIVVAEKEEIMDNAQNGRKVFEVLEARGGVPVAYHEMKGISHYGIYREGFEEATKLELDWFATHLRANRKPE